MLPSVDGGPSSPSSSFHSSPKNTELFRLPSREGFGTSSTRFDTNASFTPGVGSYNVTPEYQSALLIESPSVSRRGYKGSFGSKTPKFPPTLDSGVPGPNSYSLDATSIASVGLSRASSPTRSAAFTPSGKGRVPFPDPQPIPGPNSYSPKENPGVSPLLQNKPSSTFLSHSKRDSFIRVSETPSPVAYHPGFHPPKEHVQSDIQWSKSPQTRFQDLGKDNRVPGPQRYFNPELDAQLFDSNRSLRSCGSYRGPYVGKQSERGTALPTFGVDKDRFKHSFCGRLDLIAEIPGPGAYHDDLNVFSTVKLKSHNLQFNPEVALHAPNYLSPHRPSTATGSAMFPSAPNSASASYRSTPSGRASSPPTASSPHSSSRPQTSSAASLTASMSPSLSPNRRSNSPNLHAFGRTHRKCCSYLANPVVCSKLLIECVCNCCYG